MKLEGHEVSGEYADGIWYAALLVQHDLSHLAEKFTSEKMTESQCPCCVAEVLSEWGLGNLAIIVEQLGEDDSE